MTDYLACKSNYRLRCTLSFLNILIKYNNIKIIVIIIQIADFFKEFSILQIWGTSKDP